LYLGGGLGGLAFQHHAVGAGCLDILFYLFELGLGVVFLRQNGARGRIKAEGRKQGARGKAQAEPGSAVRREGDHPLLWWRWRVAGAIVRSSLPVAASPANQELWGPRRPAVRCPGPLPWRYPCPPARRAPG